MVTIVAIYEPRGAAREYCELACNLYSGCTHGCLYCYAPSCLRRTKADFHAAVTPRKGILEALAQDVLAVEPGRTVHFCFTCDPYPEHGNEVTRAALSLCKRAGVAFSALTKGGVRAERDFDLYGSSDSFGVTCCFTNDHDRAKWEPNASSIAEREHSLRLAHDMGMRTWVSVEPIIDPNQAIELVNTWTGFVDEWRIGRWNHDARARNLYSPEWASDMVRTLNDTKSDYMVKEALWSIWGNGWPVRHIDGRYTMRVRDGMAYAC